MLAGFRLEGITSLSERGVNPAPTICRQPVIRGKMIKIGPAGSEGRGNLEGIRKVARMQLDCMEVEFTYGVRMSMQQAREVWVLAK